MPGMVDMHGLNVPQWCQHRQRNGSHRELLEGDSGLNRKRKVRLEASAISSIVNSQSSESVCMGVYIHIICVCVSKPVSKAAHMS